MDAHAITCLSKDQWEKLVKILGDKPEETRLNGKTCRGDWIVDSGASHHMTGLVDCLFDIHGSSVSGWLSKWKNGYS